MSNFIAICEVCHHFRIRPDHMKRNSPLILSTTEEIVGREITESLGLVRGNIIRSRNFVSDLMATVRIFVGGEVRGYTKLISDTGEQALCRMVEEAENMGANAITGVRFATSMITTGTAEIPAYGTAVKLKKL